MHPFFLLALFFAIFQGVDVTFEDKVRKHLVKIVPDFPEWSSWRKSNVILNIVWAGIAALWGWWLLPAYYTSLAVVTGWKRFVLWVGVPAIEAALAQKNQKLAFATFHGERQKITREIEALEAGQKNLASLKTARLAPSSYSWAWFASCLLVVGLQFAASW